MRPTPTAALALAALFLPGPGTAAPITWTGLVDNQWFLAGNWSPMAVPAGGDEAFIQNGDAVAATGTDITVDDLAIGLRDNPTTPAPFGTGSLTATNIDVQVANTLRVGVTNPAGIGIQGASNGALTTVGGVAADGDVSVGAAMSVGHFVAGLTGTAQGRVDIQTGDLTLGGGGLLRIGSTNSGTLGSADGDLSVAGNLTAPTLTVVGVTGVGASSGNATGLLTVGGVFDAGGLNGLQIGTAGGSGTADGAATIGNGIVDANIVLVGGGGGDPNATGASTGALTVQAGGIQGGNTLSVGFVSGPGQSTGTATVNGNVSVADSVSVGRVDDAGSGLGSGDATGTLNLVDGGLTASDLYVGIATNGTGTATGTLSLEADLSTVANTIELGNGATLSLAVDGFTRGTDYSAFDTGTALLDGILNVAFSFAPVAGIFDLIVSSAINGIFGDFDTVNVTGLAPGTLFSHGTVVDGGVEIYRLQIGSGGPNPVPAPGTLLCAIAGMVLLRSRRLQGQAHR